MNDSTRRLIAIGDVHGCVHALETLLDEIAPTPADRLVFLGDLVDHGREVKEVLDLVLQLQRRTQVTLIQGNHEEIMLAARDNPQALAYWINIGGSTTLNSYRFGGKIDDIPSEHWALLDECRPYYETDDAIFTHANYLPDLPMAEQPGRQLRWALFDAHEMQPHCSGKPVIVGHTEQRDGEIIDLGFTACIDTACWRYGWLTAMELPSRQLWQASRWGRLRDPGETSHREPLDHQFKKLQPALAAGV
jgi:serine/threonine protein phosphatase 1